MAVKTSRPQRPTLQSTIYYDDRAAPKAALPYCKACGVALVQSLADTLVANDAVPA
jgi:hypothetical protein